MKEDLLAAISDALQANLPEFGSLQKCFGADQRPDRTGMSFSPWGWNASESSKMGQGRWTPARALCILSFMSLSTRCIVLLVILQLLVGGLVHANPAAMDNHHPAAAEAQVVMHSVHQGHDSSQEYPDVRFAEECDACSHCASVTPPSSTASPRSIPAHLLAVNATDAPTTRPDSLLRPPRPLV